MRKSLEILRYLILGGVFLTPFLVLIVFDSLFFPFITGKNFCFRILVELIFGMWMILALFEKKYRPKFTGNGNWILITLAAFVFIVALSSFFGENFYRSFWSNYERMEGLVTFLHLFAFFIVLTSVMNKEKLWKLFFNTSLGASVIVACYGLLQLAGKVAIRQSDVRLDATLGNASYLAIYMVFHIFLALMLFYREKKWYRWFYLPVAFLNTLILYHTATRGAILGFIGGIILFGLLIAFFSDKRKVKIFAASSLALVFIFLGAFWLLRASAFVKQSPVLSRFSNISMEETTTQSRFVIWGMSWEGFKEKPILGWGPENYNLIFNKYYKPILWKQEPWFDRAHNVFLDRLTTNGIFGLISYLGLFAFAVYYLWDGRKRNIFSTFDSALLTSMFAAYFFHNLFVFDNLVSFIMFFIFLGYIHSRVAKLEEELPLGSSSSKQVAKAENNNDAKSKLWQSDDYTKSALALIVLIFTIFVVYAVNVPGILACRDILNAFQSSAKGDLQGAFQKFQDSISRDSFGSTEASEHLASFAMQVFQQPTAENDFKAEVFEYAVSEMKKQVERSPSDIRYMVFLGALYNKGQQYDNATDILQKAIEISPKKQQLYFEIGTSYLNKKEYAKALEVLRTAFELDRDFYEARIIYAMSAIFAGQDDLAEEIMKDYGGVIVADERFLRAFAERGDYPKIISILKKIIEKDSRNAQYRVNLAAAYMKVGEKENAIEQLEKAIELEPKFKQQGEYFINEIRSGRNP